MFVFFFFSFLTYPNHFTLFPLTRCDLETLPSSETIARRPSLDRTVAGGSLVFFI